MSLTVWVPGAVSGIRDVFNGASSSEPPSCPRCQRDDANDGCASCALQLAEPIGHGAHWLDSPVGRLAILDRHRGFHGEMFRRVRVHHAARSLRDLHASVLARHLLRPSPSLGANSRGRIPGRDFGIDGPQIWPGSAENVHLAGADPRPFIVETQAPLDGCGNLDRRSGISRRRVRDRRHHDDQPPAISPCGQDDGAWPVLRCFLPSPGFF